MTNTTYNRERRRALKVLAGGLGMGALGAAGLLRWRGMPGLQVVQEARPMLGTLITIRVHHADLAAANRAVQAALEAIAGVDRVMSIHRMDSDVSRVNRAAGSESVPVSPMLTDILQLARRVNELSGGAYDVSCLPVMRLYGFYNFGPGSRSGTGLRHFPTDREILRAMDAVGERYIHMDGMRHTAGLMRAGGGIDLGSIGKGYAVDRAADTLRTHGIRHALIDAGGNILAMGSASGTEADPVNGAGPATPANGTGRTGWTVAIRNPLTGSYFGTLILCDEAVATSGNYEQAIVLDGRRVGHLFDLRNGHPADGRLSTTVVAKSAALSDALSTTLFVLGETAPQALTGLAHTITHHTTG